MMKMKVLITGANGFLGKLISDELEKKYECVTLSRNSGNYKVHLEREAPKFVDDFEIVVHCAGKAHSIPRTPIEVNQFFQINVVGTQNLLKSLESSSLPKKFVFISSVSVYGKYTGTNLSETTMLGAKDPYGLSKIDAEKNILEWCKKNNVVCSILRLPLLVGPNAPGNLGSMIKAIQKGYYVNIAGGRARKSMVLASDVTSIIDKVASIGGIYNLTDGYHPSFIELSSVIAERYNKKKPLNLPLRFAKIIGFFGDFFKGRAPVDSLKIKKMISDLTFDDSKARRELNWNPNAVLGNMFDKLN